MVEATALWTAPLLVVAVVGTGLFALTGMYRGKKGAYALMGVFGGAVLWAGGYAMEFLAVWGDPVVWMNVRFLGSTIVPVAIFVLALQMTGRGGFVTTRNVLALFAIPLVTNVVLWANPMRLWAVAYDTAAVPITAEWGPWFYVYVFYQFLLAFGAIVLFTDEALGQEADSPVNTVTMLLLATVLPAVGTAPYVLQLSTIDFGAYAFVVSGVLMMAAMFYL